MQGFASIRKIGVRIAATALALGIAILPLAGCEQIQAGIAKVIGAPTPAEVRETNKKLDAAETALVEANDAKAAAQRDADRVAESRQRLALSRETISEQIASVGAMLIGATGERYTIVRAQLDALMARLARIEAQDSEAAQLAAQYAAAITDFDEQIIAGDREIEQLSARLAQFDERRAGAIGRLGEGIRAAGNAAQDFGVPGAGIVAGSVAEYATTGLALLLGGGVYAQRRKAKQNEARAESAEQHEMRLREEANAAKEVIRTTEEFGLLVDTDPGAKAAARKSLSSVAVDLLNEVTRHVEKASKGPVAKEIAAKQAA